MRFVIVLLAALATLSQGAAAKVPGPLVNADWLAANLGKVIVLDVRENTATFTREGHVPGSIVLAWRSLRARRVENGVTLDHMLPDAATFTALMQKAGVDADSTIVIASRGLSPEDIFMATRLFWQLRYYGHDDLAVLDGGVTGWIAAGRKLSKSRIARKRVGTWRNKGERRHLLANTEDIMRAVKTRSHVLTDARPMDNYLGLRHPPGQTSGPGHIPGAKYADSTLFLRPVRPPYFRSRSELAQLISGLSLKQDRPLITYCNTGDWASGAWFVLHELLGIKDVALYDGSWHAWTKDKSRPRARYKLE